MSDRVIVLIDMDCFYCQVEERLNPSYKGHPMAVIQYNEWMGGGIIAVNYEARDRGVSRHMRGDEAKKHCPEIILAKVPTVRDKADLTRYREAGREVISVFCQFTNCVQRASVDEAYIDLTSLVNERMNLATFDANLWKSTFVVGYAKDASNDEEVRQNGMKSWLEDCESMCNTPSLRLAVGALIVEEMRAAVLSETGFKCSAGIAHNKILAKLACGLHKPNRQTVLPQESVEEFFKILPVKKIRNLGGKFGDDVVEKLGCKTMSDVLKYSEKDLQNRYDEKTGSWLYNIARGFDHEPVTARLLSKSIGCCKKFPGKQALSRNQDVNHWLNKLSEELSERLLEDEVMNKRRAKLLTVSMALDINRIDTSCSKSVSLSAYNKEKIVSQAEVLLKKVCKIDPSSGIWSPSIKYLGLSAGKFSDVTSNKIENFFKVADPSSSKRVEKKPEVQTAQENIVSAEKSSFFEKILCGDIQDSGKKLVIVPDLTRNDLLADSDESQSSARKMKCNYLDNGNKTDGVRMDCVKKNLFSTDSSVAVDGPSVNSSLTDKKYNDYQSKKDLLEQKEISLTKKSAAPIKSISSFFSHNTKSSDCWTKPEELFPDITQVDDEVLSLLPLSYRNRILKLKEESSYRSSNDKTNRQEDSNESNSLGIGDTIKDGSSDMSGIVNFGNNPEANCIFKKNTNKFENGFISETSNENSNIFPLSSKINCKSQMNIIDNINASTSKNILESVVCKAESSNDTSGDPPINSLNNNEFVSINEPHCNGKISEDDYDTTNVLESSYFQCTDNVAGPSNFLKDESAYLVKCDICGESVSDYDVHMDMHVAMKLHKELNSAPQVSSLTNKTTILKPKEKRKKKSNVMSTNSKKVKRIDAFFKK